MNCLKPDHPYYAITFPSPVHIGFGNTLPIVPTFITISPFYDFVSSTTSCSAVIIKNSTGNQGKALAEDLISDIRVWGRTVCVHTKAI